MPRTVTSDLRILVAASIPPIGAPAGFGNNLGYQLKRSVAGYQDGYYVDTQRQKFDFHDRRARTDSRTRRRFADPIGHETKITLRYFLVASRRSPRRCRPEDISGLRLSCVQAAERYDPNGNRMEYTYTPLGLLATNSIRGKTTSEGDVARPSVRMTYDFLAFENSPATNRRPIFTRTLRQVHHDSETDVPLPERDETIETVEYTDGFGRLLQTRTQGEDMRFGDPIFGGQVLPKDELPGGKRCLWHSEYRSNSAKRSCQRLANLRQQRTRGRTIPAILLDWLGLCGGSVTTVGPEINSYL